MASATPNDDCYEAISAFAFDACVRFKGSLDFFFAAPANSLPPPPAPGIQRPRAHKDLEAKYVAVLMNLDPKDANVYGISGKARRA